MKHKQSLRTVLIALGLGLATTEALAQQEKMGDMKGMGEMKGMEMKGMDMKSMPAEKKAKAKVHTATGVVKKVDPAKNAVTLAHGPVKDLNWPAMTMTFTVKDKKLFDKLAADKKVEFEFVQQGSDYVVTTVK